MRTTSERNPCADMKLFYFFGLIAMAVADFDAGLKQSNDVFSTLMLSKRLKSSPDKSLIISGFSVLPPLAQLGLASSGQTRNEILSAIQMPSDESIKKSFSNLNAQIRAVKGVELKMANRIYIANDATLNEKFAKESRDIFGGDVLNVDFKESVKTAKDINTWVEQQTNDKIHDLVDKNDLDRTTRAVLVNALYFKGLWKNPFEKSSTIEGDFFVTKDKKVKVDYMSETAEYKYGDSQELDAKLVELPYEGDEASLLIVLPNRVDGLQDLMKKLEDPAALTSAVSKMSFSEIALTIPKFKIETTTDLAEVLKEMNIRDLFSEGKAQLDKLLDKESNLSISKAIQKAFIEVNEEGTEAAAANVSHNPNEEEAKQNSGTDQKDYYKHKLKLNEILTKKTLF